MDARPPQEALVPFFGFRRSAGGNSTNASANLMLLLVAILVVGTESNFFYWQINLSCSPWLSLLTRKNGHQLTGWRDSLVLA